MRLVSEHLRPSLRPTISMPCRPLALCLLLATCFAPIAAAQDMDEGGLRPVWRLAGRLGAFDMTQSADSYDAVYGGDPLPQLGLGLELELRERWLLFLTYDYGEVDGEQVLPARPPRRTGVGTTLTYQPLALGAAIVLNPRSRWGVALGGGTLWLDWKDEGDAGSAGGTDTGAFALLGIRRRNSLSEIGSRWQWGAELRYSSVPDAVGEGGITAFFDEDDLGGISLTLAGFYQLR